MRPTTACRCYRHTEFCTYKWVSAETQGQHKSSNQVKQNNSTQTQMLKGDVQAQTQKTVFASSNEDGHDTLSHWHWEPHKRSQSEFEIFEIGKIIREQVNGDEAHR